MRARSPDRLLAECAGVITFSGKLRRQIMAFIVVDDQQRKTILEAKGEVEIRDSQGRYLGHITDGFTQEDIELAKKSLASNAPRYTTKEVLERLRQLPEGR